MSSSTLRRGRGFEGDITGRSKSAVLYNAPSTLGATMVADLDLLLIYVFCIADDLLPDEERQRTDEV